MKKLGEGMLTNLEGLQTICKLRQCSLLGQPLMIATSSPPLDCLYNSSLFLPFFTLHVNMLAKDPNMSLIPRMTVLDLCIHVLAQAQHLISYTLWII